MFTDEGRWRGVMIDSIKDKVTKLTLEQIDEVDEFIDKLIK